MLSLSASEPSESQVDGVSVPVTSLKMAILVRHTTLNPPLTVRWWHLASSAAVTRADLRVTVTVTGWLSPCSLSAADTALTAAAAEPSLRAALAPS